MLFEVTTPNSGDQTILLDKLKSGGCDVIQTSSGLVVSAKQFDAASFASEYSIEQACVSTLTKELIEKAAPDVQAFANGKR